MTVTLPAGTTLGKSFEYGVDVNLGTYAAPIWQPVRRMFGYNQTPTPQTQDAQTYDDLGAPNEDVTGWAHSLVFSAQVNRSLATGEYLPEIEALLQRTKPTAKGELAVIDVRWYHKPETGTPNPTDAGRGFATVSYTRQNTGPEGSVEVLQFTLTGKGPAEEIANPFTGWGSTEPVISTVAAVGAEPAGDGDLIRIDGAGFVGTTAVTVGGLPVGEFAVISSATIIATLPAGDAGVEPVIVTTPGGASDPVNYTRGA